MGGQKKSFFVQYTNKKKESKGFVLLYFYSINLKKAKIENDVALT